MFIAVVHNTPFWVWGLLAGLVALGLSQTRTREVSLTRLTVLPLALLGLSFAGVVGAFGRMPLALAAWGTGVAVALTLGRRLVATRRAAASQHRGFVVVPGSVLPLVLILALFGVKYFAGASLGMHPALASDSGFAAGCSLAYGVFAGLFAARALSLRQATARPAASVTA